MIVKIKRQKNRESKSYYESFEYTGTEPKASVCSILEYINEYCTKEDPIEYDCSCLNKICGACSMVINHVPSLACSTFIDTSDKQLLIEPLSKFDVVCDLVVDRTVINQRLIDEGVFSRGDAVYNKKEAAYRYLAGKCSKCGLCLEVCPNYANGGKKHFGAAMIQEAYLISSADEESKASIKNAYKQHFENTCSGCLSCRNICPQNISIVSTAAFISRLKIRKK